MSAYLVSPEHITNLAAWATHPQRRSYFYNIAKQRPIDADNRMLITHMLAAANLASVAARYGSDDSMCQAGYVDECVAISTTSQNHNLSPADIYNMCCCLEYQSCEVSDWATTDAFWIIKGIMAEAARIMAKCGTKPARVNWSYDDDMWSQIERTERDRIDQQRKEWLTHNATAQGAAS
jgi:hypothetical protein